MGIKKRGIFFSIDALIAITIIFTVIFIGYSLPKEKKQTSEIGYDIISSLSQIKGNEINDSLLQSLINESIVDGNKSFIDILTEIYLNDRNTASVIAQNILQNIESKHNIGIWFGDSLIASKNNTPYEDAKQIDVVRQYVSGLREGSEATGYVARVFLAPQHRTKYFFFGGYVGDGNITALIEYYGNITSAEMEIAINNNFTLSINGATGINYNASTSETTPVNYSIPINNFRSGNNTLEFRGRDLRISGGFIKINYKGNIQYEHPTKYFFPGVNGIVNIYDGFYVPGNLTSLKIFLHYRSNNTMYITIGNKTIFRQAGPQETTVTINNSFISSQLNYNDLSYNTVPLRIAVENISYMPTINTYIISVTDLSGGVSSARAPGCGNSGICAVREANRLLINTVLRINGIWVGLLGLWQGNVHPPYSHILSRNQTSLNLTINGWTNQGNLDLCYGIRNATETLANEGTNRDKKFIILLGTKFPNSCLGISQGDVWQNTYELACLAWTNHNITINTIGIIGGSSSDRELNNLLREIALCTNGSYYNQSANNNNLIAMYNSTINDILRIIFNLQTASATGGGTENNTNLHSILYPDSYIEYEYLKESLPFGTIITSEKIADGQEIITLDVPFDARVIETKAVSYSGPYWTNLLTVNNNVIYNLTRYGNNYVLLGDPYTINIPNNFINIGSNNSVRIFIGASPSSLLPGSSKNKLIYTIVKNATGYSPIASRANGCIWTIEFEDNSNITIRIPENYNGTDMCYFTSSQISYDPNDAIQIGVARFLSKFDTNRNGKLDIFIRQGDVGFEFNQIVGVPFSWGTEIQVRTWY